MVIERGHSRFHIDHHGHDGAIVRRSGYKDPDRGSALSRRLSGRIEAVDAWGVARQGSRQPKKAGIVSCETIPLESGEKNVMEEGKRKKCRMCLECPYCGGDTPIDEDTDTESEVTYYPICEHCHRQFAYKFYDRRTYEVFRSMP